MNTIHADPEVRKYMRIIAQSNRWDQLMIRGCTIGIFTAFGTVLGLGLLFYFGTQLLGDLKQIPFIDSILEQTKLDVIIENQVNRLKEGDQADNTDTAEVPTPDPQELDYQDALSGLSFSYPPTFTSIRELQPEGVTSKTIQLNGPNGVLHNIDIYVNRPQIVEGESVQRFVPKEDIERLVVNIYEQGATVNGTAYTNPVFYTTTTVGAFRFDFVGLADPDFPKLAREIFTGILESAQFRTQ